MKCALHNIQQFKETKGANKLKQSYKNTIFYTDT